MCGQMPTAALAPTVAPPPATDRVAGRYWRANLAALALRQPAQAATLADCETPMGWCTARDRSVTLRDGGGGWFAGCSVPLLAGRALLKSLVVEAGGHCLLAPAHAGLLVAARERLGSDCVLFVVQPDLATCRVILGCCDVSDDLSAGRLWIAAGVSWASALRSAFEDHPGLAAPARFIQTRLTPSNLTEPLIAGSQQIIGAVAVTRAAELDHLIRDRRPPQIGRTVIIAGSRFRLWQPGADAFRAALPVDANGSSAVYDTDDALTATAIALARATDGAATIVTPDLGRSDAASVVSADTSWITWQTRPTPPSAACVGREDHLILADPNWRSAALDAGWRDDHIHIGTCERGSPNAAPATPALGLIADTCSIDVPDAVQAYSSHQILWEAIAAELHDAPHVVADSTTYLVDRARRLSVDPSELNTNLFIERLIQPAYAQGLARLLLAAGLPVQLWGDGWTEIPEFTSHVAGIVGDPEQHQAAIAASTAVVRHLPGRHWHPLESCGRPVVSAVGQNAAAWLAHATAALRPGAATPPAPRSPTLAETLARLLANDGHRRQAATHATAFAGRWAQR